MEEIKFENYKEKQKYYKELSKRKKVISINGKGYGSQEEANRNAKFFVNKMQYPEIRESIIECIKEANK